MARFWTREEVKRLVRYGVGIGGMSPLDASRYLIQGRTEGAIRKKRQELNRYLRWGGTEYRYIGSHEVPTGTRLDWSKGPVIDSRP